MDRGSSALIALDNAAPEASSNYAHTIMKFGDFVALPTARQLLLSGRPVCIGGRAFDLLILLLTWRGKVVSNEIIARHVWPATTVDKCNLRFQVSALRKALGVHGDMIKTVPGRGYLLAEEVMRAGMDADGNESTVGTDFAAQGQRAICDALHALADTLSRHPDALASVGAILSGHFPQ